MAARKTKRRAPAKAKRRVPATAIRRAPPKRTAPKRASRSGRAAARTGPANPSAIGFVSQHMDYTSQDLDAVKRFYTELLGFSRFVHQPEYNYLGIQTGPSSSLGFMPPMPGPPEQWRPPREPAIYLYVRDVDRAHAALTAKGVTFEQTPMDAPWGHRFAMLRDPEGRMVCLAHRLKR